jgi:hypothetical protein
MGDGAADREANHIAGAGRAPAKIRPKPRSREGSGYNLWHESADLEEE